MDCRASRSPKEALEEGCLYDCTISQSHLVSSFESSLLSRAEEQDGEG